MYYELVFHITAVQLIMNCQFGQYCQIMKTTHKQLKKTPLLLAKIIATGKSLSEAFIFASTNPQFDHRLFIVHENCKLRIPAEHVVCTQIVVFVLF